MSRLPQILDSRLIDSGGVVSLTRRQSPPPAIVRLEGIGQMSFCLSMHALHSSMRNVSYIMDKLSPFNIMRYFVVQHFKTVL